MEIDQASADPPYVQVAADLAAQIRAGKITGVVPSITTLMQTYGIAKNTARKALHHLAGLGYAKVVPGWRTVVTPRESWPDA